MIGDGRSATEAQETGRRIPAEARGEAGAAAARPRPCVEFRGVDFSYGSHRVLEDVSFRVRAGEILCVLGGSGEGKTTILRLILRLVRPDAGSILVESRDIAEASTDEVLEFRQRMGMVFQGSALFDSLTAFDNVAFPLEEHTALDETRIQERVKEVLRFVDLDPGEVEELLPAELSGGMRKRVGIARAIVHEPEILLFDEPTSGLDPITTRTINELILKLRSELGVCAVVVTHDIRSAAQIANRLALLREGRVVFIGEPEEMFASEDAYVRAFLG